MGDVSKNKAAVTKAQSKLKIAEDDVLAASKRQKQQEKALSKAEQRVDATKQKAAQAVTEATVAAGRVKQAPKTARNRKAALVTEKKTASGPRDVYRKSLA